MTSPALISGLLRRSILQLCKASIPPAEGVEVDGIVCIALGKHTNEQIVVKIHEILWETPPYGAAKHDADGPSPKMLLDKSFKPNYKVCSPVEVNRSEREHVDISVINSGRKDDHSENMSSTRETPPVNSNRENLSISDFFKPKPQEKDGNSAAVGQTKRLNKRKSSCPVALSKTKQYRLEMQSASQAAEQKIKDDGIELISYQEGDGSMKREKDITPVRNQSDSQKQDTSNDNSFNQLPEQHKNIIEKLPQPICIEPKEPNEMYVCEVCKVCFHDIAAYNHHIETTQHGRVNTCQYCNRTFTNFNAFVFHMRSHGVADTNGGDFWKGKPLRCGICTLVLRSKRGIIEHMRTEHQYVKCYTCTTCEEIYPDFNTFRLHRNQLHSQVNQCRCEMCELFFTFTEYKDHEKECMIKIYFEQEVNPVSSSAINCRRSPDVYSLNRYSDGAVNIVSGHGYPEHVTLSNVSAVAKHNENVTIVEEKPQAVLHVMSPTPTKDATKMPQQPNTANNASSPILKPTEGPFRCQSCFLVFPEFELYETHNHEMHSRFVCSYCAQSFATRRNLQRHARRHTGVRPYQCMDCDASFTRDDDLKKHMFKNNHLTGYKAKMMGVNGGSSSGGGAGNVSGGKFSPATLVGNNTTADVLGESLQQSNDRNHVDSAGFQDDLNDGSFSTSALDQSRNSESISQMPLLIDNRPSDEDGVVNPPIEDNSRPSSSESSSLNENFMDKNVMFDSYYKDSGIDSEPLASKTPSRVSNHTDSKVIAGKRSNIDDIVEKVYRHCSNREDNMVSSVETSVE